MQHYPPRAGGMSRRHPIMETGTKIHDLSLPTRTTNWFQQILPPTGLIVGVVLTTVWICFLGFQIVKLVEAVLT